MAARMKVFIKNLTNAHNMIFEYALHKPPHYMCLRYPFSAVNPSAHVNGERYSIENLSIRSLGQ